MDGKTAELWRAPVALNGRASTSTARATTTQNATGCGPVSAPSASVPDIETAIAARAAMTTTPTKPKKPGARRRGTRLRSAAASIAPP
jgi:hypothetical protein